MKKLLLSVLLSLSIITPTYACGSSQEVLRAVQSIRITDARQYFHGQVYLLNMNRPRVFMLVLESGGMDIARTRCLLKKDSPRKFVCNLDNSRVAVRRKRGNSDILNVVVRGTPTMVVNDITDHEITTKVIINYRVAEYTSTWQERGHTLTDTYIK